MNEKKTNNEVRTSVVWYIALALVWVGTSFAGDGDGGEDAYRRLQDANEQMNSVIQSRAAQISANQAFLSSAASSAFPASSVQEISVKTLLMQRQNEGDMNALKVNRGSVDITRSPTMDRGINSGGNSNQATASPSPSPNPAAQTLQVPSQQFDTSGAKDDQTTYLKDIQNQLSDLTQQFKTPISKDELPVDQSIDAEIANIKQAGQAQLTIMEAAAAFAEKATEERKKHKAKKIESIEDKLKANPADSSDDGLATAQLAIAGLPVPTPGSYSSTPPKSSGGHRDTLSGNPTPADTQVVTVRGSGASQ